LISLSLVLCTECVWEKVAACFHARSSFPPIFPLMSRVISSHENATCRNEEECICSSHLEARVYVCRLLTSSGVFAPFVVCARECLRSPKQIFEERSEYEARKGPPLLFLAGVRGRKLESPNYRGLTAGGVRRQVAQAQVPIWRGEGAGGVKWSTALASNVFFSSRPESAFYAGNKCGIKDKDEERERERVNTARETRS